MHTCPLIGKKTIIYVEHMAAMMRAKYMAINSKNGVPGIYYMNKNKFKNVSREFVRRISDR